MIKWIQVIIYVVVLALCARFSFDIPFTEINITGQTLSLTTLVFFLGSKECVIGIFLYLILGICGLPFFSDGNFGWDYFIGSSFGYFIGFIVATLFLTFVKTKLKQGSHYFLQIVALCFVATLIILILGTMRLSVNYGFQSAISNGFTPFLLGGIIKSIFSAILVVVFNRT